MLTWDIVDDLAAKIAKPNARRMWRARGIVPHRWRGPLIEIAAKRMMLISWRDFDKLRAENWRRPRRKAGAQAPAEAAA